MGEPEPVKDELDRALASMRAGFLSGSSQIAAGIGALEEHLAGAPQNERERVGAAVAQIVSTQERLIAQIERLPPSAWDRFKSMVGILKAQQAILDDLGALVQQHVLPRQLQGLSAAAASAANATAAVDEEPPIPLPAPAPPRRRRVVRDEPEPERERKGSGFKGLAAMIVAAVVLSLMPRETKLQDMAAKLVAFIGMGQSAPADVANAEASAEPPKAPPSGPRAARVPKEDDGAEADSPPPPTQDKETSGPRAADAKPAGKERTALVPPEDKRGAAPPKAEKAKPAPARPRQEQFVPVLFTHRDKSTVLQTMNELQQQYPKLLMDREGQVLSVKMGKKGVWHRLAFLPAASRPEATKLCDQLMAEGYDRCWVKFYETE
jgi:hypothetical protein